MPGGRASAEVSVWTCGRIGKSFQNGTAPTFLAGAAPAGNGLTYALTLRPDRFNLAYSRDFS